MARIISCSAEVPTRLSEGWRLLPTAAQACESPQRLPAAAEWLPATVPGTVAEALRAAGQWTIEAAAPLHQRDYWYHHVLEGTGQRTLRFHGLATCAEVWLDDTLILRSENMFHRHEVAVELHGKHALYLCFRSLDVLLNRPAKRARWRPAMIVPHTLRTVRTTLLGHMPGWCPPVHAIGPWRAIECIAMQGPRVAQVALHADLLGATQGRLRLALQLNGHIDSTDVRLHCAGRQASLSRSGVDDSWHAELLLDDIEPWWPHTHGTPRLYAVKVTIGEYEFDLGQVGFRRIRIETGDDGQGFGIVINDVPVFCRGACWTSADIVGLRGERASYEPWLRNMQAAHMNMVRVGGTGVYESPDFHALCDELGIMVWQDFMFANFDYPVGDAGFESSVKQEVAQLLDRLQSSPSLTVLCGGSEVAQQAAMLGLPVSTWSGTLFGEWLPQLCAQWCADVPYVPNSPSGGALPFIANAGVTHYYGVGAYERPLEDARRAEVRFASECLAFANVPEAATLERHLPVPAMHHPQWKQRTPRDVGASWDFEDTRDHYFKRLYALDPALIRRTDPERYLELSRAITGLVMEAVFAEWRRARSTCRGGLVWNYQDLWPGAGWGVVDATGEPKPAWHALRRAFRPVQLVLSDEGVNGLGIHIINDTPQPRSLQVKLACLRGTVAMVEGERLIDIDAHSALELGSATLLERFFDITYAYRFGPPAHEVSHATLHDAVSGELLAEAMHFPQGFDVQPQPMDWQARVEQSAANWYLVLRTSRAATAVHIRDEAFRAEDNWFHLMPGVERRVRLLPRAAGEQRPDGEVRALNTNSVARYRASA